MSAKMGLGLPDAQAEGAAGGRDLTEHPGRPARAAGALLGQLIVLAVLVGVALPASADSHYIRAGATGADDGSSWANAWTSFADVTWVRGDTYFVAGGTYSENVLVAAEPAAGKWIRVRKANATDNSKDASWLASYANDQALIKGAVRLANGCVELDGVTGKGTSGHGFKIHNPDESTVLAMAYNSGPYHVYHCEVRGPTRYSKEMFDGIHYNNGSPQKGLHIANCWVHECGRNGLTIGCTVGTSYEDYGMLFENNVIEQTGGNLRGGHSNPIQIGYATGDAYLIIRNNVFRNNVGSAPVTYLGGRGSQHRFSRIYNNLFIITDRSKNGCSPGVIWAHAGATSCKNIEIYNNTFYGVRLGQCALDTVGGENNVLVNNVWENCEFTGRHRGFSVESNNGYFGNTGRGVPKGSKDQVNGDSTTFVNAREGDFSLLPNGYAVDAGIDLSSMFATDFAGKARGDKWDIGAHAHE
jgi:hypothetical protein